MNFPLYYLWTDKLLYIYSAACAGSIVSLIYAIRRWLELANAAHYGEDHEEAVQEPAPLQTETAEETLLMPHIEEMISEATQEAAESFAPAETPAAEQPPQSTAAEQAAPPGEENTGAENFVSGLYGGMARIDARLGVIEDAIAKGSGNRRFVIRFLEGLLEDYDSLSLEKIKGRITYLISDLKANAGDLGDRKD